MAEEYGLIRQAKPQFPVKELIRVPHEKGALTIGVFGPNYFSKNVEAIKQDYSHPRTGERISFREPTTSESISVAAYGFGSNEEVDAKRDIFDPKWLQPGRIVRTPEGVFTNISVTDNDQLKKLLDNTKKVNGIYLIDDDTAFAPYESFEREVQSGEEFARGGLARALEHTDTKVAKQLGEIASKYKEVNVLYFDPTSEPVERVASLSSYYNCYRLDVDGYYWIDLNVGFAFGVCK